MCLDDLNGKRWRKTSTETTRIKETSSSLRYVTKYSKKKMKNFKHLVNFLALEFLMRNKQFPQIGKLFTKKTKSRWQRRKLYWNQWDFDQNYKILNQVSDQTDTKLAKARPLKLLESEFNKNWRKYEFSTKMTKIWRNLAPKTSGNPQSRLQKRRRFNVWDFKPICPFPANPRRLSLNFFC